MPPVGFEPTIPASGRPQNYALDRAATETGHLLYYWVKRSCVRLYCVIHKNSLLLYRGTNMLRMFVTGCYEKRKSNDSIFINKQLDTQFFFLIFVYSNSLHVSGNQVLIIRRVNCINTTSGMCHCM